MWEHCAFLGADGRRVCSALPQVAAPATNAAGGTRLQWDGVWVLGGQSAGLARPVGSLGFEQIEGCGAVPSRTVGVKAAVKH